MGAIFSINVLQSIKYISIPWKLDMPGQCFRTARTLRHKSFSQLFRVHRETVHKGKHYWQGNSVDAQGDISASGKLRSITDLPIAWFPALEVRLQIVFILVRQQWAGNHSRRLINQFSYLVETSDVKGEKGFLKMNTFKVVSAVLGHH